MKEKEARRAAAEDAGTEYMSDDEEEEGMWRFGIDSCL